MREKESGEAARLRDMYLEKAEKLILENRSKELFRCLSMAAADFDRICKDETRPKVGIVGEIFLKFNPFSHKNITGWLIERGIEVVPPMITGFFMQSFVNRKVKVESYMEKRQLPGIRV